MGRLQSLRRLNRDVERLVERQRALPHFVFDAPPVDELHRDKGVAIGLVNLVNRANVGMVQSRGGLCFPHEAGLLFFACQPVNGRELEGDGTAESGVFGLVNRIVAHGGGGAKVQHVPVRAGPDVPRGLTRSLRGSLTGPGLGVV